MYKNKILFILSFKWANFNIMLYFQLKNSNKYSEKWMKSKEYNIKQMGRFNSECTQYSDFYWYHFSVL